MRTLRLSLCTAYCVVSYKLIFKYFSYLEPNISIISITIWIESLQTDEWRFQNVHWLLGISNLTWQVKVKLHLWSLKVSRSCECLLVSPMKLELWQFFTRNTSQVDKTVLYCTESVNPEVFGLSYFAINLRSEITKDLHFACSSSHKWCVTYVFVQYFCQARIFTFTFTRQR